MTPPLVSLSFPHQYCMVLIELFHPLIHGIDEHSDPSISSHFLIHSCYHAGYLLENDAIVLPLVPLKEMITTYIRSLQCHQQQLDQVRYSFPLHPIIRNYNYMLQSNYWHHPHIAKCIVLQGGEKVAILKTHWIRLIQRTWKRVYHTPSSTSTSTLLKNKKKINIPPRKRLQGMLASLKN